MAVVGRSVNSFNVTRSTVVLNDERVLEANVWRVQCTARLRKFVPTRLLNVTHPRSLHGKKIPNARHLIAYVFNPFNPSMMLVSYLLFSLPALRAFCKRTGARKWCFIASSSLMYYYTPDAAL